VKGYKHPATDEESKFTGWQESARKDIERAFGVLQSKFKVLSYPIHMIEMRGIASLVTCCLVLHNMGVSDRVMGDARETYCPSKSTVEGPELPYADPEDVLAINTPPPPDGGVAVARRAPAVTTNLASMDRGLANALAEREEWMALKDVTEWSRLQRALISFKGSSSSSSE
jgi:hypothetical protein